MGMAHFTQTESWYGEIAPPCEFTRNSNFGDSMQFDDRLATVLRMQAGNERAARTQFRQLLDLIGSAPTDADHTQLDPAYVRLSELSGVISSAQRADMIREPGVRLRDPELTAFLAGQETPVASAAMATAKLSEPQWAALIPVLPVPARAFLRHRRDLSMGTDELLTRLGVRDLVLTGQVSPDSPVKAEPELSPPLPAPDSSSVFHLDSVLELESESGPGIGALVKRIEAFQRARQITTEPTPTSDAPRLPLGEQKDQANLTNAEAFDFSTDAEGRINWADPALAPMTVGISLTSRQPYAPARADVMMIAAMRRHQPVHAGRITMDGAPAIAGEWRVDAAAHFSSSDGRFTGYRGRMRRPIETAAQTHTAPIDSSADRMRQLLHELRTPVNAIQGFAEIIQQQLFGPTPNEYRALAAAIAGDSARILAGFEELDRLAKLESNAMELEVGSANLYSVVAATTTQLDSVLQPRSARLEFSALDTDFPVAIAHNELELLTWRILATVAGTTSPGEALQIKLSQNDGIATLVIDLPASLADRSDIFDSSAPTQVPAVTSGMFGAGFTLRLARAEAVAAGGELIRGDDHLTLTLPLAPPKPASDSDVDMDYSEEIADIALN